MENPAELVLMGANPMRLMATAHGFHENPEGSGKFGIKWRTGTVTGAYETRAEAENVLRKFHGKGEIIGLNPVPLRRRNPATAEQAREIRSGFVDQESTRYFVLDEPHIPSGDYAELGTLYSLAVKPERGGQVQDISFAAKIHVISASSRRQIYFAGKGQSLDSHELQQFSDQAAHGAAHAPGKGSVGHENVVMLGECREIIYVAKKYHPEVGNEAAGKEVEWRHRFGEETGDTPTLWYDTKRERLILRGGAYRVEDAGIIN